MNKKTYGTPSATQHGNATSTTLGGGFFTIEGATLRGLEP